MSGSKNVLFWQAMYGNINNHWSSGYGGSNYDKSYYDTEPTKSSTRQRHSFSPILLVYTTVFDCKLCGAKKENCSSDYCEEKDDTNLYDGDW